MFLEELKDRYGNKIELELEGIGSGGYEILKNGEFYCSCDNMSEVREEVKIFKKYINSGKYITRLELSFLSALSGKGYILRGSDCKLYWYENKPVKGYYGWYGEMEDGHDLSFIESFKMPFIDVGEVWKVEDIYKLKIYNGSGE